MTQLHLIIGNKEVSTWSLRPWLVLTHFGIPFRETLIPFYQAETRSQILKFSPSGRVPALIDGEVTVWDSLAICEYLAELYPEKKLWPSSFADRAHARAISAEMHSGFASMRQQLSAHMVETLPCPQLETDTRQDLQRVQDIWTNCFERSRGPFLFGDFSIADAMFAPVLTRFRTYSIPLSGKLLEYQRVIFDLPAMQKWLREAAGLT